MNLEQYLRIKSLFHIEKEKIEWIRKDHNIWKFTRPIFQAYSPPFRGLTLNSVKVKQSEKIVEILANHYEKHFDDPTPEYE
jgi:hypothetical protein